jgi:hypothetical protein
MPQSAGHWIKCVVLFDQGIDIARNYFFMRSILSTFWTAPKCVDNTWVKIVPWMLPPTHRFIAASISLRQIPFTRD